jgi:hypothetical protein
MSTKLKITIKVFDSVKDREQFKDANDLFNRMWKNPKTDRFYRLTPDGFAILKECGLKFWKIKFKEKLTSLHLVLLDRYLKKPWYLTSKSIYLTDETAATMLILYNSDVDSFIRAQSN